MGVHFVNYSVRFSIFPIEWNNEYFTGSTFSCCRYGSDIVMRVDSVIVYVSFSLLSLLFVARNSLLQSRFVSAMIYKRII